MIESHLETEQMHDTDAELLVSVIVPVYNTEEYLEYCLESILHQTYRNLEIILIDDGSTDKSGEICDGYAVKDHRIRVIHKQNGGLSAARNTGLEEARGEWITFVDSDDYIRCDMIEKMIKTALKDKSDLVHVLHKKTSRELDYSRLDTKKDIEIYRTYFPRDYQIAILSGKLSMYSHGKLYKRELFEKVRFPEGKQYEDVPTTWAISKTINKASYIGEELYFYRQRKGSIVNAEFKPGRMDQVYAAEEIYKEVKNDPVLEVIAGSRCYFSFADNYSLVTNGYISEKEYLRAGIKKYKTFVLNDNYARKALKISAVLCGISPELVRATVKLYKRIKSLL